MRINVTITWKRMLLGILALAVIGVLGALLVAWSGLYNVAASRGHPLWLNWFLELGMRRSVEMNAPDLKAPNLDDPGLIALGASHFQGGCAACHGGPGEPVNPIYNSMLPKPPHLQEEAPSWSDHDLHWIVMHGLQYAGMPGWAGDGRGDEVWAVVAFLRVLPELDEETYFVLAQGNSEQDEPGAEILAREGSGVGSLANCAKCHGTQTRPPTSDLVPRLAGQNEAYLLRALKDYREGHRQSGFMQPVAAEIPEKDFEALAAYFAGLDAPPHPVEARLDEASIDRGRDLAATGDGDRAAACNACHIGAGSAEFPRLNGQSAAYIESQLRLWQQGGRSDTPYGELMRTIAEMLDEQQIRDVAAYYADQPPFQPDTGQTAEPAP